MQLIKQVNDIKIMKDDRGRIVLTDDWSTDWIVFYSAPLKQLWACDGVFGYNRETIGLDLCLELDKVALQLRELK